MSKIKKYNESIAVQPHDIGLSVSGYTMQRNRIMASFREQLQDMSTDLDFMGRPKYSVSNFEILKIIEDNINLDVNIHITFNLNGRECFGVFKNLVYGTPQLMSDIFDNTLLSKDFTFRLTRSFINLLYEKLQPELGNYKLMVPNYIMKNSLGEFKTLFKDDVIQLYRIEIDEPKILHYKLDNVEYVGSPRDFQLFKTYFMKV